VPTVACDAAHAQLFPIDFQRGFQTNRDPACGFQFPPREEPGLHRRMMDRTLAASGAVGFTAATRIRGSVLRLRFGRRHVAGESSVRALRGARRLLPSGLFSPLIGRTRNFFAAES